MTLVHEKDLFCKKFNLAIRIRKLCIGMILLDMRGKLPYRYGDTSRPFRTDSDDVLFGVTHYYYISALYEVKITP